MNPLRVDLHQLGRITFAQRAEAAGRLFLRVGPRLPQTSPFA